MRSLLILAADAPIPEIRADLAIVGGPVPGAGRLAALRAAAPVLYVRPEPDLSDLPALLAVRPEGVLLAPVEDGAGLARLGNRLAVHEAEAGLPDGALRIVAVIGTARGILRAGGLAGASPRLAGLGWDADALARDLGVRAEEPWPAPLAQARATILLAAAAARVPAIETAGADPHAARRDGFSAAFVRAPAPQRPV